MRLLCVFPSLLGVFHRLAGQLVSAQVISLSVMLGSGLVGMGGEEMEFRSPLM